MRDPTSEVILEEARAAARSDPTGQSDERWEPIRALHRRADETIFRRAASWCSSEDVVERVLGADVLAQLGAGSEAGPGVFATESEPILSRLLADPVEKVVMAALYALGHLEAGEPVEIVRLSGHESSDVRHAVAYALGGREDALSIGTLVTLSGDRDDEVRDWATFGLGTLCHLDTAAVREALLARVSDMNPEVRGEALVGLAVRGDRRVVPHLTAALQEGSPGLLELEASEKMLEACPDEDELRRLVERWTPEERT